MDAARRATEAAARQSYGRLVAILARRSGDIAAAEDALSEAFAAALATWPARGVPDNPEGWLMTAARRNLGAVRARSATATAGEVTLALLDAERAAAAPVAFGDARLELLFVCAHPALSPDVQAPLMLQTVLGLDAARIAASFLVSPAAMGQKLVRAKAKIRVAGIPFQIPDANDLTPRLTAVLDAIYAAYGTGWDDVLGSDAKVSGLTTEAIWLGRLLVELMPEAPEAMGLLSLMLHCDSRATARRSAEGAFVTLRAQNPADWKRDHILEAEALLRAASHFAAPGRYQTEAAIQSLHAQAVMTGEDLSAPLMRLYDLLVAIAPSTGACVARAVAYAEGGAVSNAASMLDAIGAREDYQPLWAARARIAWLEGDKVAAQAAAERAAALSRDPSVRDFLLSGALFAN